MFKKILFLILAIIHILIWIFVVFSFINKKTAYYNLYYVIPFIYIIHMLPSHAINQSKKSLYPNSWEDKSNNISHKLIIGYIFEFIQKIFQKSFASPVSPQGLLILGSILSAYRLKQKM